MNDLKALRQQWEEQAFDIKWRTATGEDVPTWLQETPLTVS